MKRIFLFVLTNLAVVALLGIVASLLGVNTYLAAHGLNSNALLSFSMVMGLGGAFISLLMSKWMAKISTGAEVITQARNEDEAWILETVKKLSQRAGIEMPEVAIFDGEPNAFATGAFKNAALVAVSTGLLQGMSRDEIEAVLGHEITHIANGDMVTLTLIQGVLNTFVVFLSRLMGYFVDNLMRSKDDESRGPGWGYYATSILLDVLLGFVASMIVAWFSRQREFRADEGSVQLLGKKEPMISALNRLGQMQTSSLPASVSAMGIAGDLGKLFASHPPLEERFAALQTTQQHPPFI